MKLTQRHIFTRENRVIKLYTAGCGHLLKKLSCAALHGMSHFGVPYSTPHQLTGGSRTYTHNTRLEHLHEVAQKWDIFLSVRYILYRQIVPCVPVQSLENNTLASIISCFSHESYAKPQTVLSTFLLAESYCRFPH